MKQASYHSISLIQLNKRTEVERAKLLCFYTFKETDQTHFFMSQISDLMIQCGFSTPNTSRLRDKLLKG